MNTFLIDKLKKITEESVGGMVAPMTSQGNPTVSYLPGGFTSIRNILRSLSKLKKQWNLEILEENDNYKVKIEDALNINVPKTAYKEFNSKVFNTSKSILDISDIINEDKDQAFNDTFKRVKNLLYNINSFVIVRKMLVLMHTWIRLYPKTGILYNNDISLNLKDLRKDADKVLEDIKLLYSDDLGKLEILLDTLYSGKSLVAIAPFLYKSYFVGIELYSVYQGVKLKFILRLDNSWQLFQYIKVYDSLVEDLKVNKNVKVVKDNILPVSGQFSVKDLTDIKKELDDLINA